MLRNNATNMMRICAAIQGGPDVAQACSCFACGMMLSDLVISVNVVGVMSYSLPSTKKGGGYAECSTCTEYLTKYTRQIF